MNALEAVGASKTDFSNREVRLRGSSTLEAGAMNALEAMAYGAWYRRKVFQIEELRRLQCERWPAMPWSGPVVRVPPLLLAFWLGELDWPRSSAAQRRADHSAEIWGFRSSRRSETRSNPAPER